MQTVMRLYEGARTKVRVDSELSEPFVVKVGAHQVSVLSFLLFMSNRCVKWSSENEVCCLNYYMLMI